MEKAIRILLASTFLFLGIIIGFLLSPVKKGVFCGNYNGNVYGDVPPEESGDVWTGEDEDDD